MKKNRLKDVMQAWEIRDGQTNVHIDTVWFRIDMSEDEVKHSLIFYDGFLPDIVIRRA